MTLDENLIYGAGGEESREERERLASAARALVGRRTDPGAGRQAPPALGGDARVVWEKRQAFSTVSCLEIGSPARRYIVKGVIRTAENRGLGDAWRNPRARLEYETLAKLHEGLRLVEGCLVPRPVLLLEKEDALVMEYCPGRPFGQLFRGAKRYAGPASFGRLAGYVRLAGRWIRQFQGITGTETAGRQSVADTLDFCLRMLAEIGAKGSRGIPRGWPEAVSSALTRLAGEVHDDVRTAQKHDDYGPWNMIAAPGGLAVIDFAARKRGPLCSDPLKMLVFFEDLGDNPLFSGERLKILRRDFVEGYGQTEPCPRPVAAICEAKHRISSLWHAVSGERRGLCEGVFDGRKIKRHVGWLAAVDRAPVSWPAT